MKTTLIRVALFAILAACPAFSNPVILKSLRSTFVLIVPEKWKNSESDLDFVKIQKEETKGNKDTVNIVLDSKGVKTVVVSQSFPLRVSTTTPSKELPYTLIVFERQKAGWETELIEAVAVTAGSARFLTEDEYKLLSGTHDLAPKVIDTLNEELNKHRKESEQAMDANRSSSPQPPANTTR